MTRLLLETGTIIIFGGRECRYLGQNDDGVWLSRPDEINGREVIAPETLIELVANEKAEIKRPVKRGIATYLSSIVPAKIIAFLDDLQCRKTYHRWVVVLAAFGLKAKENISFSNRCLSENKERILADTEAMLRQHGKLRAGDVEEKIVFPSGRAVRACA